MKFMASRENSWRVEQWMKAMKYERNIKNIQQKVAALQWIQLNEITFDQPTAFNSIPYCQSLNYVHDGYVLYLYVNKVSDKCGFCSVATFE